MKKLSQEQQTKIAAFVQDFFGDCKTKMGAYREDMKEVYEAVTTFKRLKRWTSAKTPDDQKQYEFIVNKAFEIENKVLPKVFWNNPNWIVTYKPTYKLNAEADTVEMADMVRDHLYETYKKRDVRETLKLLAKGWIRFWNAFVKVDYKYNIERTKEKKEEVEYDEYGDEVTSVVDDYKEDISEEYACIDYKSWTDMYYDPRYLRLEDFPWIIEVADKVRISYFAKNKNKFINTELLVDCCIKDDEDYETYKRRILDISWISITEDKILKPATLQVKKFYWYYDLSGSDNMVNERLYEFWTVNDAIVVYAKEISQIPYEDFRVFLDTETYLAKGYIQAIIWLQNELNHQKITAQDYINKAIYPPMVRSPNSWIDPRQGNPWPWALIMTSKDVETALNNFKQFPFRDVPAAYRQNQNDLERQIQAGSFTIDTSNPMSQQSLTNTATWARIKEFESNAVTGDTRKEFENVMSRLGYKLLQEAYDNMEWNIRVKKKDWSGFWEVNKEAFKNALSKYDIRIEAWSSSFDSVEQRRDDAIARMNLALQVAQAGVPVDLKSAYENVMSTFEWVDTTKLFVQQMPMMPWVADPNLSTPMPNAITPTI